VPAADGTFVPLSRILRAEPVREEIAPIETAPIFDLAELARDVRLFRARLADAFDAGCDPALRKSARAALGREIDAVLEALLERLQ
jgi:hypothetical protein